MTNQEIWEIAFKQSAYDCSCRPEDFLQKENKVVLAGSDNRARAYLPKPLDMENFMEIVETYCAGQKAHDILLLEDYNPFDVSVRDAINELKFSFFSVNDVNAAVLYLNKNIPKAVCVSFDAGRFEEVRPRLKHDRIIYVENRDTIKKLALLLK